MVEEQSKYFGLVAINGRLQSTTKLPAINVDFCTVLQEYRHKIYVTLRSCSLESITVSSSRSVYVDSGQKLEGNPLKAFGTSCLKSSAIIPEGITNPSQIQKLLHDIFKAKK
ncbi:hypothetical protein DV737_g5086, partial [Chaetothyriales sp. CBS 132003]